jgi:hypothetical protein
MAGHPQRALIVQPAPAATARACRNLRNVLARNALELRKPTPRFRWSDFFDDLGEGSDTTASRPIEMGRRSFPTLTDDTARDDATAAMPGTLTIAVVAGAAAAILVGSLIWLPDMPAHWATADLPRASQQSNTSPPMTRLAKLSIEEPSRLALYAPLEDLILSDQPAKPHPVLAAHDPLPIQSASAPAEDSEPPAAPPPTAPERPAETVAAPPPVRKSPPRVAEPATTKEQRPRPKVTAANPPPAATSQGHTRQAASSQQRTAAASHELKGPSIFNPLTMLLGGPFEPSPPPQDR